MKVTFQKTLLTCMLALFATSINAGEGDENLSRRDSFKRLEKYRGEQEPEREQRFYKDDEGNFRHAVDMSDIKKAGDSSNNRDYYFIVSDDWFKTREEIEQNKNIASEAATDKMVEKYGRKAVTPVVQEMSHDFSEEYLKKNFPEVRRYG